MKRIASVMALTFAATGTFAGEWRMAEEGELLFQPTWEGESLPGRFGDFDVRLDTDDGGVAGAKLEVTVNLDSADMDDPDINEAIVDAEWFAVSEHPVATYTSDSIEKTADGAYLASGQLDLKGVRLPVDVPFRWSTKDGRAEMSGEVVVNRTRFDVGSGEWASGDTIGTEVRVSFNVILERQ
jgi:polyisoprenoid-binding protein YceI